MFEILIFTIVELHALPSNLDSFAMARELGPCPPVRTHHACNFIRRDS